MNMFTDLKRSAGLLLGCALALCSGQLCAQSYSIDWFKLADGGGASTSAVYSISATIAQHDASKEITSVSVNPAPRLPPAVTAKNRRSASADYALIAGFWAIYAVQVPGAPRLRIVLTATNTAVVAWPAPSSGWTLQVNTNLDTIKWQPAVQNVEVVGSENQVIVSPPIGDSFFRLYFP